ncbi:hypothetical protein QJS10_CPA08g00024 [Acorus calamus]|uniref:G domain-containing protein n=1 Tax=Acorus calamus TaxID=4465 RepID=A0AAV9EBT3_ACOCL|nr:hypothetical protein QJS10_CPA08g00024 [Acorus calamus]
MGKKEKSSTSSSSTLGRALVRHHNQMAQQSREMGRPPPLEFVTDVTDIDAVSGRTGEADRLFSLLNTSSPDIPFDMLEENEKLILTPFEKNLDIWRQLWRVLERSDLLVMVVDARDPLFYRCPDLETEMGRVLAFPWDTLSVLVCESRNCCSGGKKIEWRMGRAERLCTFRHRYKNYGREELLARLQSEAEEIVLSTRRGWVCGLPKCGEDSTINALVGEKRTGVTSTPGKTKHFQTLIISEELTLCDCPGLVFPSFSSSRYEMIASGVLPIDRMTEHGEAVQVVCNRVPRHALEGIYKISLAKPKPKPYELQSRPPLAVELLRTYCASLGYVGSSGLPDETRAARKILKDYIDGKLPHFEMPPGIHEEEKEEETEEASARSDSDESEPGGHADDDDGATKPGLKHILDDLVSFEMSATYGSSGAKKKKVAVAAAAGTHKHHKKPQRKKDRSWRVGNDGGDGMPVARVFQKLAVN